MVRITGRFCTFQEARGKRPAHIFALCDTGDDRLMPVSLPRHKGRLTRGVESEQGGYLLRIQFAVAARFDRAIIGMSLPAGHDFGDYSYLLQLAFEDGSSRLLHLPLQDGVGKHYALVASLALTPDGWSVGRLDPPELFADKQALGRVHPLPDWWLELTD